jgi:hypothetical protein
VAFGFSAEDLGVGENNSVSPTASPSLLEGAPAEGGNATAEGKDQDISSASVNAEASLLQGGYDASVSLAVESSKGLGVDEAVMSKAVADFAREAEYAIKDGRTLDDVRFADPNLSHQAQTEIFEKVALQNGTSSQELEQRQAEADAQTMQALQQGIVGTALASGAAAQTNEQGLTGALNGMSGQSQPQQAQQQAQQQAANPFGISSDILASLRGTMVDFGEGTKGFAAAMEQDAGYSRTVAYAEGHGQAQVVAR